jgi:hypothetical protein
MRAYSWLPGLCAVIIPPPAPAAQASPAPFSMTDWGAEAPIEVDGRFDAAWNDVPAVHEFVEYRPRQGAPASVRTEVRFARDRRYVYAIARMFDPDIGRLRSGLARRDNFSNEQDWISIAIDPVGARRVAQLFYFNPDGVVWDGLSNEDTGSATPAADFEVDVATRIEADGWLVELRIPFDELRYASRTPGTWHVLVRRNYPREERHAMAAPAIPASAPCFMCLAAPVHPPGDLPALSSLGVTPQLLALVSHDDGPTRTSGWRSDVEPSLDVKWRMSPSTVFDAALNPDFSQVDLDTPQLSSNRQFAVSLPEKRPFFLEGLDIVDSPLAAIYTRSITDPAWGVRGTHRGRWDGVLLTTHDDGGGFVVLPGAYSAGFLAQDFDSYATLGRLRRPTGAVTMGGLFTDRRTGDGYNTVMGPDLSWRLSPGTRINAQWLTSRTRGGEGLPGPLDAVDGDAMNLDLLHDSRRWRAKVQLQQLDEHFRADNGYLPQVGVRSVALDLRHRFLDLPRIAELAPYVTADRREALDGGLVSFAPRAGVLTTLPNNLVLTTELRPREELRMRPGGELHEVAQGYVALTSYPGGRLPLLTMSATWGEAVDFGTDRAGRGETWSASLLWRPLLRLEVQPSLDLTTIRVAADDAVPATHLRESAAQLLTTLHLSARSRFRLIAQHVAVDRSGGGSIVDESRLVGSLLFTHERSLTRRFYGGFTWASARSLALRSRDTAELFIKLQWGMSSMRGWR